MFFCSAAISSNGSASTTYSVGREGGRAAKSELPRRAGGSACSTFVNAGIAPVKG